MRKKMSHLTIRTAKLTDLDRIMELYAIARTFMKEHGNPTQWGETYPSRDRIQKDIEDSKQFVCIEENQIVGTFYYAEEQDPTYDVIMDGNWLSDEPYGVVHRITTCTGKKGIASFCLDWCLKQSNTIRIDTHENNIPMQRMLNKNGFQTCGIIFARDQTTRIAYQKVRNFSE